MLIFWVMAWSTMAFAQTVPNQAVTFADLQGTVIEVSAVHQQHIKRDGKDRRRELRTEGLVKIWPGDMISATFTNTNVRNGGMRAGEPRSGTFTLGKPRTTQNGDDVVWQFSDNSLIRLRAYGKDGAGGSKQIITFQREPDGLHCNFSMDLAREDDTGPVRTRSRVENVPVQILESKQVSSTCRVVK
jgi:hypothetical protein